MAKWQSGDDAKIAELPRRQRDFHLAMHELLAEIRSTLAYAWVDEAVWGRVLTFVAQGLLNKQIADRLDVQERTVKAHLSAIFDRLGVRNRTQASVVLRELELSDPARHLES